jgi:FkbM family methyltransferase
MISLTTVKSFGKLFREIGFAEGTRITFKKCSSKLQTRNPKDAQTEVRVIGYTDPISLRIATSDWSIFHQIFVDKEYQEPSQQQARCLQLFYEKTVEDGRTPVIIDCGANIGLASIWYASKFSQAKVVSIEPEPSNFALLQQNTSRYRNIIPYNAAISNRRTRVTLSNISDAPWAWETSESSSGAIEAITIDDAISLVPNAAPLIAKIDIEGFETDLFQSNYEWLKSFPLVVFEHHDWLFPWRGTAHAVYEALTKSGPHDYVQCGENVFSYSHTLLKPS